MMMFEPMTMRNVVIANRFVAQAMEGNDGENGGVPSERTLNRYRELARGGWGVAVVEAISVWDSSLARVNGMILNRRNLDAFKRLVSAYKKENREGRLFFQLTHSGEQSGTFSDRTTLTPDKAGYRYLSSDELARIKDSFVSAGLLAEEAGADGIDFKMCHGYLGGEILRPANTRADQWGGVFENRTRLLREVITELKAALHSSDFILGSRLSLYEGIRGGCGTAGPDELVEDLSEMLDVIRLMDNLGMDYVNISAGIPALTGAITRPTEPSKYLVLHHLRYTKTVRDMLNKEKRVLKVIGSAYSSYKAESINVMEEMLVKGYTDLCGFGRQNFADPHTPRKVKAGEKVNWCVLCSGCTRLMVSQHNDGCVIYNDFYKEELRRLNKEVKND
jgi:2,4-dienoyl-CoA reductase-like NADH-dependent reductase (Old Yellow Enzyme family)